MPATNAAGARLGPVQGGIDLTLLVALLWATGGAFSPVRQAFFVGPVVAAATQTPRTTTIWAVLTLAES